MARRVFLLMGQSNMIGLAPLEAGDTDEVPGVYMLDDTDTWVPAAHPLHPSPGKFGLGLPFALDFKDADMEIGLVPCATGTTELSDWEQGGAQYTECVRRAAIARTWGGLHAALWHQGETDANLGNDIGTYDTRLYAMVEDLRDDTAAPNLIFIGAELAPGISTVTYPYQDNVNAAVQGLGANVDRAGYASSAGLTRIDAVHFDHASLQTLGERYSTQYQELLMATPTTSIAAVRNQMALTVVALTPTSHSTQPFRLTMNETEDGDFREYANGHDNAVFREFEIEIEDVAPLSAEDYAKQMQEAPVAFVMAYPHHWNLYQVSGYQSPAQRYGNRGAMMAIIEEDAKSVLNAIGRRGGSNYVSGQLAAVESSWTTEEGDGITFLVIPLLVTYYRDVS